MMNGGFWFVGCETIFIMFSGFVFLLSRFGFLLFLGKSQVGTGVWFMTRRNGYRDWAHCIARQKCTFLNSTSPSLLFIISDSDLSLSPTQGLSTERSKNVVVLV